MIRISNGRGDWAPRQRIAGLHRYAFIGDSMTYGAGVAPDETLPVTAERQMNEMSPGLPVETVNLGIPGYNLWNAWHDFKVMPQVYDGVVIILCNNDAEMFGRTLNLRYGKQRHDLWDEDHACGRAVARCRDDIRQFTTAQGLAVLVISYNLWDLRSAARTSALCAERELPFIATHPYLKERSYAVDDLTVSRADRHPSALAHEAIGRQAAGAMKRLGWFAASDDPAAAVAAGPARILAAAQAMVAEDRYPQDTALAWARRALDAQTRLARRLQRAGPDSAFGAAAQPVAAVIAGATQHWHAVQRLQSLVQDIAMGGHGVVNGLAAAEDSRLKLDELAAGFTSGGWNALAETLDWPKVVEAEPAADWAAPLLASMQRCAVDAAAVRETLDALAAQDAAAPALLPAEKPSARAAIDTLLALFDRIQADAGRLTASTQRLADALEGERPGFTPPAAGLALSLVTAVAKQTEAGALSFLKWLPATIARLGDAPPGLFTIVEVTCQFTPQPDIDPVILTVRGEYAVPWRLSFHANGYLSLENPTATVTVTLPIFYAGRLVITLMAPGGRSASVDLSLVKVEVSNRLPRKRTVEAAAFTRDAQGRFASPLLYLA
jgi:hypothetical protein